MEWCEKCDIRVKIWFEYGVGYYWTRSLVVPAILLKQYQFMAFVWDKQLLFGKHLAPEETIDAFEYDFGHQASGTYLIKVETAKGVETKRVTVL